MENRNDLVEQNLKLVGFCMNKLGGSYFDDEDEKQEGYLALIDAADRFDASRGINFSSFAIPYIIGRIQNYRTHNKYSVRPTRGMSRALQMAWTVINDDPTLFEIDLSNPDCVEKLVAKGIDINNLNLMMACKNSVSLDSTIHQCKDDSIRQDRTDSPKFEDAISGGTSHEDYVEIMDIVNRCIDKAFYRSPVSDRNKQIVLLWVMSKYYGLGITEVKLSKMFQITRAQINNIIKKFRNTFIAEYTRR